MFLLPRFGQGRRLGQFIGQHLRGGGQRIGPRLGLAPALLDRLGHRQVRLAQRVDVRLMPARPALAADGVEVLLSLVRQRDQSVPEPAGPAPGPE